MTSRVFAPQKDARWDLTSATGWGEIQYLFEENVSPMNPDRVMIFGQRRIKELNFDPAQDYFLMTAKSGILALCLSLVLHQYGPIRCLFFDARTQKYIERQVTLPLKV